MKQKYTITIADVEMNVITDESPEAVDSLVGMVDRRIREIRRSSSLCSKSEAALLCALDYCAEKVGLQRQIKTLDAEIALKDAQIAEAAKRAESLMREIEKLKAKNETLAKRAEMVGKIPVQIQMNIEEEPKVEEPVEEEAAPVEAPAEAPRRVRGRPRKTPEPVAEEAAPAPAPAEEKKATPAESNKKRLRSMFDLITFDRIDE